MNSQRSRRCDRAGCCGGRQTRRDFLKSLGFGAGVVAVQPWQAMAGPFSRADFDRLVPADKKLRPEWLRSLTARGERAFYHGAELGHIGMPIGGLCAGQVYLGGDGRLWHWDIFNQHIGTGAEHYAKPMERQFLFEQGFAIRVAQGGGLVDKPLDREHWADVSFTGEYPIGFVRYSDPAAPVSVALEAFSPFIPLNTEDSSLPATLLEFTITNTTRSTIDVTLAGWLQNAVCLKSARSRAGFRRNRLVRRNGFLGLECSAEELPPASSSQRPDISFDDFERETYGPWKATGSAFGSGPVETGRIPGYQGDVAGHGRRVVNTHASAPGQTVEERDSARGTLTSARFTVERDYISFLIGGGAHEGRTCLNLVVDGNKVLSATGENNNRMRLMSWDVRRWAGKAAMLEIVDQESGPWGNIGVDDIVFSDSPRAALGRLAGEPDFGTMTLAMLEADPSAFGSTDVATALPAGACDGAGAQEAVKRPFEEKLVGCVGRRMKLRAGSSAKVVFAISWHMPNLRMARLPGGRYYATRFDSATAVALYLQKNYRALSRDTRLWHDTWYDSSLPYWFLDRTFLNTSILASSTCHRFADGRFYAWEGVGCCEGTCGHVWQYAQAAARLFPDLERMSREKIDFGLAQQPNGAIHFRGEFNDIPAIDAQAGTILRALREHQVCATGEFLARNWPRIKLATDWLIAKDENADGLIESNQHNTLDTDWFGPVAWLSGLYLAALRAAQVMATEQGDQQFAGRCGAILDSGRRNLVAQLFDGEYFLNKPDPKHLDAINSGTGCEIDQVFGQSWAWQVGLPRVLPRNETLSALGALWRYNFTPDVGPYRTVYKPGRWYAMPGEAGLLMCTFPRSDWDYEQAKGRGPEWAAGYFNECMNGFEYQVAGHMLWEGMVTEGLAVARAVHDRYHPARRNPWNEVECGDHYARSMASYGVFLAACGFEYHGPKGHLGFAPRVQAGNFKAAFTTAEGWGTFSQRVEKKSRSLLRARVELRWGKLRVRSVSLELPAGVTAGPIKVLVNNRSARFDSAINGPRLEVSLAKETQLAPGGHLEVQVG